MFPVCNPPPSVLFNHCLHPQNIYFLVLILVIINCRYRYKIGWIFVTGCQNNYCHRANSMEDKQKNGENPHYYLSYIIEKVSLDWCQIVAKIKSIS